MGVQPTRKGKGKGKQVERQGARHSREQKPDEGATMQDWLSLFDFQITRRHIYYYNHATRCVDQPCQSAALWPVLWVLATFHPRRIWCGKSSPNMDNFKASLNVFANRNRWRWFIRDTPRQQFSICVPPHGKTKVCTHPAAPPLDT